MRPLHPATWLCSMGLLLTHPAHVRSEEPRPGPLPIETALRVRRFLPEGPIHISPNANWVAYTLRDETRRRAVGADRYQWFGPTGVSTFAGEGCDIWISHLRSGETRNLTGGQGSSWSPVWSPDGKRLAFYSDRGGEAGLWIWEQARSRLRRVSRAVVRPLFASEAVRWTPDSRQVLCKILPVGMTVEEAAQRFTPEALREKAASPSGDATIQVYRSFTPAEQKQRAEAAARTESFDLTYRSRADLALIDAVSGAVKTVARDVFPYTYDLSPDGRHLFYTTNSQVRPTPGDDVHDLFIYSLKSRSTRQAAALPRTWWGRSVSWAPTGSPLGAVSYENHQTLCRFFTPDSASPPRECRIPARATNPLLQPVWHPSGRSLLLIVGNTLWEAGPDGRARPVAQFPALRPESLLASDQSRTAWSRDGGASVFVRGIDPATKEHVVSKVRLASGQVEVVHRAHESWEDTMASAGVGGELIVLRESAQQPPDLWTAPISGAPRRITRVNRELDRFALGGVRLIDWTGRGGQKLQGALLLPPDYRSDRRYPLVVRVYGNSRLSNQINQYGLWGTGPDDCQLLATRGFAVLLPDAPLGRGRLVQDLAGTVLPGIDRAIELGVVDPQRIGIAGHSYGGYSTLALLTQDQRFKAAVITGGFGDLMANYGHMREDGADSTDYWERILGATPWKAPELFLQNSPLYALDRVRTPLLMIHGANDVSTPAADIQKVFVGLRRLGQKVEYAAYLGEGHVPARWNLAHQRDSCERMLRWFTEHLSR